MELVSIIVPTYKRDTFLKRALQSLADQTYKNIEVVVVDDNAEFPEARKRVAEVVESLRDRLNIRYVVNPTNLGGAISRNAGIREAGGRYITFLDDDDEFERNKVELQYRFYRDRYPLDNGIIYSQSRSYDSSGRVIKVTKTYISSNGEALKYMMSGNIAKTGNWFIPKEIIEGVGGFKKLDCGQEWYLIFKILERGYECTHMKEALLRYHEHENERITTNYLKKFNGEKILYEMKKNHIKNFPEEIQRDMHYRINILLASYAVKVEGKEAVKHLREAMKYRRLKVKDLVKIAVKSVAGENTVSILKRRINLMRAYLGEGEERA